MHRQIVLALSGAQLGFAHVQRSQITDGPRNLVRRDSANIEIHQIYGAPIGVDTHYLARVGTSIKWIGHNNDYLTEVPETTTINGVKTTMEVKQQLLVVTATAAAEGVAAGDVSLLITESMQRELQTLVKAAAASCGAPARKSKRDGMSCMINAFQTAAHNDHALAAMNPAEWGDFLLEPARNAPQILTAAFQVLKTQAERNKFAVMVAAASVSGAWVAGQVAEPAGEVAYKYVFDNGLFGSSQDHPGPDQKTVTTKPTAISTASACNPTGTIDENSPACDDKDCKGDDKNVCAAEGKFKGCPCAHLTEEMIGDPFYKDFYNEWGNVQQKILKELKDGLPEIIPPQCFKNSLGNAFDGKPLAEPSGYCVCSSAKSGGSGMTTGLYSTMSGTGSSVCAYSTMPTKPISLSKKPIKTGVPVTSCRVESSYSLSPYCTCNDDAIHGHITTTWLGKVTTVCPDAKATLTSTTRKMTPTHSSSPWPVQFLKCSNDKGWNWYLVLLKGGPASLKQYLVDKLGGNNVLVYNRNDLSVPDMQGYDFVVSIAIKSASATGFTNLYPDFRGKSC